MPPRDLQETPSNFEAASVWEKRRQVTESRDQTPNLERSVKRRFVYVYFPQIANCQEKQTPASETFSSLDSWQMKACEHCQMIGRVCYVCESWRAAVEKYRSCKKETGENSSYRWQNRALSLELAERIRKQFKHRPKKLSTKSIWLRSKTALFFTLTDRWPLTIQTPLFRRKESIFAAQKDVCRPLSYRNCLLKLLWPAAHLLVPS